MSPRSVEGVPGFAILGLVAGLTFTLRGGDVISMAYRANVLPLIFFTLVALLRSSSWPIQSARGAHAQLLRQVKQVVAQPVLADQPILGSPDVVAVEADQGAGWSGCAGDAAPV